MIKIKYIYDQSREQSGKSARKLSETPKQPKIYLSNKFIETYNLKTTTVIIRIGNWSKEFTIKKNRRISEQAVGLPKDHIPFPLPKELSYQIKVEGNIIHIGPVIGFMAQKNLKNLTLKKLEQYRSYFKNYTSIGGLIFVCASDSVNISDQMITGYYYNPLATATRARWKKGIFPYPDSLYKKIKTPLTIQQSLKSTLGNRIFNTNYFNKLDFWNVCAADQNTKKLLPHTKVFRAIEDLEEMVYKYGKVYIKPVEGMQGNGIVFVKKKGSGILVINKEKKERFFTSKKEAALYFNKILTRKKGYLIQQAVVMLYKDQQADFRLYFQKDKSKQWICQGTVGRFAQQKSIVTNFKHVASIHEGKKALQLLFNVEEEEANNIMNKAVEACREVCTAIDNELGQFGDFAIDVIIDEHQNPWILEVNSGVYGCKSLRVLKDYKTLSKIKTTPFEFAKALAGFE
jgi:dsDNA-binding SOS-regulon protein